MENVPAKGKKNDFSLLSLKLITVCTHACDKTKGIQTKRAEIQRLT